MSISAPFIRQTGRDHAIDRGGGACGSGRLSLSCRSRLCLRWTFPPSSVQAKLPGASPETMASSVATPLERQFGRIAGVTEMTSSSSHRLDLHCFAVRLESEYRRGGAGRAGRDQCRAGATADQSAKQSYLQESQSRRRADPDARADLGLSRQSADVRHRVFHPAAEALAGKRRWRVDVGGGALPAVRVDANPTVLNHYGLGLEDLRAVLGSANANRPKGALADRSHTWALSATDQLLKADAYRPLIVSYQNGGAVRLADVATRHRLGGGYSHRRSRQRKTRRLTDRLPSTGRKYYRDRRSRPRAVAVISRIHPTDHQSFGGSKRHHDDSRFGP